MKSLKSILTIGILTMSLSGFATAERARSKSIKVNTVSGDFVVNDDTASFQVKDKHGDIVKVNEFTVEFVHRFKQERVRKIALLEKRKMSLFDRSVELASQGSHTDVNKIRTKFNDLENRINAIENELNTLELALLIKEKNDEIKMLKGIQYLSGEVSKCEGDYISQGQRKEEGIEPVYFNSNKEDSPQYIIYSSSKQ